MKITRLSSFFVVAALPLLANCRHRAEARSPAYSDLLPASLSRRTLTGQTVAFACYGGGGDCECPADLNGDSGVLINVFPGFQCAYPNGACTWEDKVGFRVCICLTGTELCVDWSPAEHCANQLPVCRVL